MISLENIYKKYHKNKKEIDALKGVSLKIQRGDIYGIIGYSGSGKSTLLRTINQLERPSSGRVIYRGEDITGLSEKQLIPYRRKMGMIFQQFNLLSSATVFSNVAYPLELIGTPKNDLTTRVDDLLNLVGLADKKNEYPASLSGGQKQRVAIARALATNPEILLCDECTSALDPNTTRSILSLLKMINRELGVTIVLITHEMEVIKAICNTVSVLSDGEIIETDAVGDLLKNSKSEITKEFFNSSLIV